MAPTNYLIEMDEESHTYYVDGDPKTSTTQVLHDAGMVDTQWFTEFHRWRGSETHKVVAAWSRAGKIDKRTVDAKIRPYATAGIKWQIENKFKAVHVEHRMYDPMFDVCGTADLIGYFEDDPRKTITIVDWKSNDWKQGQLTSKWQTASYSHMYDAKGVHQRIEVVLGPDGNYGPVNTFAVDTLMQHVNEFCALNIVAKLRREGGLLK